MAPRPTPLPAVLGTHFSVREARIAGATANRLRASDVEAPFRGVRMLRPSDDGDPSAQGSSSESPGIPSDQPAPRDHAARERILNRAFAYARVMPAHALFTHVTAALFWGLPVPLRATRTAPHQPDAGERALDVGVFAPHRPSKAAGVRGVRVKPHLVTVRERRGLRLSSPASTWAQLGAELSVDELIVMGDAIVQVPRRAGGHHGLANHALSTMAELSASALAGRRIGAVKLREALDAIRVGSASPPETDLRVALARAGLPEPELDFDVVGPQGEFIGYTEIAYPEWRVLVEYEGDHHRVSRKQWNRDIEKHAQCAALDWTVLRITASHLYPQPSQAVARVRAALERAGWRP